jgi:hypothetical protein
MTNVSKCLLLGLVIFVFGCAIAWGQATAQISGTVRDATGAVLPGVDLTATQTQTGIRRATVTNETGSYVMPNLTVGPYRLEASLPGFRTFVQTGIVLQVNGDAVVHVVLEVGQVTETVEVQANVMAVETRSTAVGQVMDNERILELPLNGRQVTDLITLSGGAVQTGNGSGAGGVPGDSTVQISVAGGLSFGVSYALDGAMHIDMYNGANHPMPFPDALEEFRIEASGISAGGGMRSGGAVNAVTKSGTNEFHGDLFEFVRNYKFNARNFFAARRDSLKRNQYGGTVGGPIVRDKLFFFGGYQGTKTRSDPTASISYVPTPAVLAGDFTAFASPACSGGRQINLSAPFVNNRIDPALYSPAAVKVAARLPQAQDECGQITWGAIERINEMQAVGKVDYQKSINHSIFGRYLATTYDLPAPRAFQDNVLTSTTHGRDVLTQAYALGSTYLLSPTSVNAFRLTVNRTAHKRYHAPNFSSTDVGVKSYTIFPDRIDVSVAGGFTLGGNSHATFRTTSYQMSDDVNLVRGDHQLAFGVTLAHWRTNQYAATRATGSYDFDGSVTGLGMADFLTGRLTTLEHGTDTAWGSKNSYIALYASDVWRAASRLTLNYGVRWEPFLPLAQTLGVPYHFDYDRFQRGIKSTVYPNGPAGFYFRGDPDFPGDSPLRNNWLIFNPRVGLAWDVQGNGRTSVRASAGIATDFTISSLFGGGASAPPWGFRTEVESPSGGFDDPWSDYPGGSPVPYIHGSGLFTPFAVFAPFLHYDANPPKVQSWNLSLQRQVGNDWVTSASYIGSATIHVWALRALNNAVYFPGAPINGVCTAQGYTFRTTGSTCSTTNNTNVRRRLYLENPADGQYIGVLNAREDGGTSNYHGMLLSIQRRAASGLNVGANYTWSHCIGLRTTFNTNEGGEYVDPNDRNFDRGNCESDRRHIFNLNAVASTPQFANSTLRTLAGGWRLSGIYRRSTGSWMTVGAGEDRALIGDARNGVQRADQVLPNPYGDRSSYENYLDIAAFARPAAGKLGVLRPNNIEGPGSWQFDMAVSRTFRIGEVQRLEFRGEGFNVTNSLKLNNPQLNFRNRRFGQINSADDARIMQFVLKYVF